MAAKKTKPAELDQIKAILEKGGDPGTMIDAIRAVLGG